MAQWVRRPRTDGGESIQIKWKFDGRYQSETFTDARLAAEFRTAVDDSPEWLLQRYQEACDRSRAVTAAAGSLDQRSVVSRRDSDELFTLRWILCHMIEETARHNGHADLLREHADGATGE